MTVFQNVRRGLIPARLTVADIVAMQAAGVIEEDERFELIGGEIIPLAAMKSAPHEDFKRRLARAFTLALGPDTGVFVETSIQLDLSTYVEPDIAIFPADIASSDVEGRDIALIIEIATSSIAFDLVVKAPLYAVAGVAEYWVVDASRKTIRIHRAPEGDVYSDIEEYEAHDEVSALFLPALTLRLDALD